MWSTSPNMYSIRGDLFRDAREWAELMKNQEIEMRRGTAEEAEHLIGLFDKYRPEKAMLVARPTCVTDDSFRHLPRC